MDTINAKPVVGSIFNELVERKNGELLSKEVIIEKLNNEIEKKEFLNNVVNLSAILHQDLNQGTGYLKHALYAILVMVREGQLNKDQAKHVIQEIVENKHFFNFGHDNGAYTLRLIRALLEEGLMNKVMGTEVASVILDNGLHESVGVIKDEALGLLDALYKKRLYNDDSIRERVRIAVDRNVFGEI